MAKVVKSRRANSGPRPSEVREEPRTPLKIPAGTHHHERVSRPQRVPSRRTLWKQTRLTVDRHHVGRRLAHAAPETHTRLTLCVTHRMHTEPIWAFRAFLPADVILQERSRDEGRGTDSRLLGGQPIGVVVACGVAAGAVRVTEEERHGGETWEAAAQSS